MAAWKIAAAAYIFELHLKSSIEWYQTRLDPSPKMYQLIFENYVTPVT
jgi:hypothetical protein